MQVHRTSGRLVDAPVHPSQHRANPLLTSRGYLDGWCAVPGRHRLRNGHLGVRADGPQPSKLRTDGRHRVDSSAVPLRSVHADKVAAVGTVVPVRGVLAVGNERESTVCKRISAQRGHGHVAEPGQLRASGQHLAILSAGGGADNRLL